MKNEFRFSVAGPSRFDVVCGILQQNDLPYQDLDADQMNSFILALDGSVPVGCIGLEIYTEQGLLRSLAVESGYRNQGIGSQLVHRLIGVAAQRGVKNLHLLTNTAESFFSYKGFRKTERSAAPAEISQSAEFSYLCPSSAVYMVLENISGRPVFYDANLQHQIKEPVSGSLYWEIFGQKMSFTYFEVPAHSSFEKHSHEKEQITFVLEGELFFSSEENTWRLCPGDSIVIPSNAEHRVWTGEKPVKAVDAWSKQAK